jgi:hypothetical protein
MEYSRKHIKKPLLTEAKMCLIVRYFLFLHNEM